MTEINMELKQKNLNSNDCAICNKQKHTTGVKLGEVMGGLCDAHYDALMEIQFDKEIYKDETL